MSDVKDFAVQDGKQDRWIITTDYIDPNLILIEN